LNALHRIVLAALIAGTIAGILAAAIQAGTTWPLIREAEHYEAAHDHADEPSEAMRTALTVLTTVLAGIGFGLILCGGFALSDARPDARAGAIWGAAGFATFSLAPALGLPPEPPGAVAAELAQRQLWWLATVLCTGAGLWLIAFRRGAIAIAAAIVLIALPHLIGAPRGEGDSVLPAELAARFVAASLTTSAAFWVMLGAAAGAAYAALARRGA
jgi:cobalt transporter subunit CbtA